jgi:hypothetical protein
MLNTSRRLETFGDQFYFLYYEEWGWSDGDGREEAITSTKTVII